MAGLFNLLKKGGSEVVQALGKKSPLEWNEKRVIQELLENVIGNGGRYDLGSESAMLAVRHRVYNIAKEMLGGGPLPEVSRSVALRHGRPSGPKPKDVEKLTDELMKDITFRIKGGKGPRKMSGLKDSIKFNPEIQTERMFYQDKPLDFDETGIHLSPEFFDLSPTEQSAELGDTVARYIYQDLPDEAFQAAGRLFKRDGGNAANRMDFNAPGIHPRAVDHVYDSGIKDAERYAAGEVIGSKFAKGNWSSGESSDFSDSIERMTRPLRNELHDLDEARNVALRDVRSRYSGLPEDHIPDARIEEFEWDRATDRAKEDALYRYGVQSNYHDTEIMTGRAESDFTRAYKSFAEFLPSMAGLGIGIAAAGAFTHAYGTPADLT